MDNDQQATPEVNETPEENPQSSNDTSANEAPASEAQETAEPEQVNEGADAPDPTKDQAPPEEEDFDPLATYGNFQQGQYQFTPAEDGTVDPVQVARQIEHNLLGTIQFQRQEQRAWEKIDKKWGEHLTPARRELILNARIANAINGKDAKLTTIADRVMSEFTTAKSEGRAEAGISRKVQKAASLETATSNTGPDRNDERYDRIMAGDKAATDDLLADWLKQGKI